MSICYEITCGNTAAHPTRTIATVTDEEFMGLWTVNPARSDLTTAARNPKDGYVFTCRCGERAACHRGDLHEALHRLGADGRRILSIRGLHYLRRLERDPIRPPQPLPQPPSDDGGFLMPTPTERSA